MTVRIVIGRTEGFVSSVGFLLNGLPFLYRGKNMGGMQWESKTDNAQAVREFQFLVEYLQSAGVVVENRDALQELNNSG